MIFLIEMTNLKASKEKNMLTMDTQEQMRKRPSFQRMLEEVKSGKINAIIVKRLVKVYERLHFTW